MTFRPWGSVAFRLALNYGALVVLTLALILAVFYVQTVGVFQKRIDRQIELTIEHLVEVDGLSDDDDLARLIQRALRDDQNADTEIYVLFDPAGTRLAGNIAPPPVALLDGQIVEIPVLRNGREIQARVHMRRLRGGEYLVVGTDLQHQREIEQLFQRAALLATLLTLAMAVAGAVFFQREVEERASDIRRVVGRVGEGRFGERIPLSGRQDEFARLNHDVNNMLDQLERLMQGVRHVSNTVAHNLRTPLTRILLQLRDLETRTAPLRPEDLAFVSQQLEELATLFDKLLALAEVESGAKRQDFVPVRLEDVAREVIEFYEPVAEEQGSTLALTVQPPLAPVHGDPHLLASALANLVDNALKHTADVAQAAIEVRLEATADGVALSVIDNGPGIPAASRAQIGTHFYRVDARRPGHGLGLANVLAIVRLHGGSFTLGDAGPGLHVRVALPTLTA